MKQITRPFVLIGVTAIISITSLAFALEPSKPAAGQQMSSGSSAGQPSDSILNKQVENALAHDPLTNGSGIQVRTQDRMVTLSGTAGSRQVAKRAEQLASQINGVKGVEDYIHYTNR